MSKVFVIAQGGGPTAVINQTVAGAALEARKRYPGSRVLGARHGVRGVSSGDFVDLSEVSEADLRRFGNTPSAGLGSTRDKPDANYCGRVLEALRTVSADAFIYIGGNDTSGTLQILHESAGGSMAFMHAPKTIDNDLVENDHTPGFISAAWFTANAFLSVDLDFRALPGIYVGIVMGRHAGFLTAASAAWRREDQDGPHLVYGPERPFSTDELIADIQGVRERFGMCIVAMSEGVSTADGKPMVEALLGDQVERDAHGNVRLSSGDLGMAVQHAIGKAMPKVRSRVDTFGYLPRANISTISPVDRQEAFDAGAFAVEISESGSKSVALKFENGKTVLTAVPLDSVAGKTRLMPAEFLDATGRQLSDEGMAYLARLLPERPESYAPFV
jgi:6-phosphofructokinase 1